jgi:hypothetical protein
MLKRSPILAILLFSAFALFSPAHALAEETTRIATLDISVWPEYDQPGVLVQYQGQIAGADKSGVSRDISVLVPKGAGVGAACGIKSDGNHTSETWRESDAGDGFTTVSYKMSEPQFHVEFYYNPLVGATDKTMEFTYKAASAVDDLYLEIQHPLKATNFTLSPDAPNSHTDKDGFTYHVYNQKQVAAGETVLSKISYTKTDPNPSVSGQKSTPATAANQETPSGINPNLVVLLAVLVAAAGLIAYFAFIRRAQPQFAAIPVSESHGAQRISLGGFCTGCGNAMEPEDGFCANCGKERKEIVEPSSGQALGYSKAAGH